MNISMAWVWPAFVARSKTVTRRQWTADYAKQWRPNTEHSVWNRSARFGGQPIGVLRCVEAPYQERTGLMPDSDYAAEGLEYLDTRPFLIPKHRIDFAEWQAADVELYVLRFEIVVVSPVWDRHLETCIQAGRLLPEPVWEGRR